jgi:hypothetical protein
MERRRGKGVAAEEEETTLPLSCQYVPAALPKKSLELWSLKLSVVSSILQPQSDKAPRWK